VVLNLSLTWIEQGEYSTLLLSEALGLLTLSKGD